jgi:hypothetical protein
MYVCVCVYIYKQVHTSTHVHICEQKSIEASPKVAGLVANRHSATHTHTHVHIQTSTYTYTNKNTSTNVHIREQKSSEIEISPKVAGLAAFPLGIVKVSAMCTRVCEHVHVYEQI